MKMTTVTAISSREPDPFLLGDERDRQRDGDRGHDRRAAGSCRSVRGWCLPVNPQLRLGAVFGTGRHRWLLHVIGWDAGTLAPGRTGIRVVSVAVRAPGTGTNPAPERARVATGSVEAGDPGPDGCSGSREGGRRIGAADDRGLGLAERAPDLAHRGDGRAG